jgi:hypothetical protein
VFGFSCQQDSVLLSGVPKVYTLRFIFTEHLSDSALLSSQIFSQFLIIVFFIIMLDKYIIISDSVISAVTFAMGYSIYSVQRNKTHFRRLCSSHLFFVGVQNFHPRKSACIKINVYS